MRNGAEKFGNSHKQTHGLLIINNFRTFCLPTELFHAPPIIFNYRHINSAQTKNYLDGLCLKRWGRYPNMLLLDFVNLYSGGAYKGGSLWDYVKVYNKAPIEKFTYYRESVIPFNPITFENLVPENDPAKVNVVKYLNGAASTLNEIKASNFYFKQYGMIKDKETCIGLGKEQLTSLANIKKSYKSFEGDFHIDKYFDTFFSTGAACLDCTENLNGLAEGYCEGENAKESNCSFSAIMEQNCTTAIDFLERVETSLNSLLASSKPQTSL